MANSTEEKNNNTCIGCTTSVPKIGIYHARNGKIIFVCTEPKPEILIQGKHYLSCKDSSCGGCLPEPQ